MFCFFYPKETITTNMYAYNVRFPLELLTRHNCNNLYIFWFKWLQLYIINVYTAGRGGHSGCVCVGGGFLAK